MRLAVERVPRSNGSWLRGAIAAEKTVSVNGSLMDERDRETESHDLPERGVKGNMCLLEKPPSVKENTEPSHENMVIS